jgi:hypothetical protein
VDLNSWLARLVSDRIDHVVLFGPASIESNWVATLPAVFTRILDEGPARAYRLDQQVAQLHLDRADSVTSTGSGSSASVDAASRDYFRGQTHRSRTSRDIAQDHGVRPDLRVIADHDASKYLGPSADVNVPAKAGDSRDRTTGADRHLLKDQTVWPDLDLWVKNDSVGVWDH